MPRFLCSPGLGHLCTIASLILLLSTLGSAAAKAQGAADALDNAVAQAQSAQAAGQYAAAATAYAKATSLDPSIPELWANRGLMEHLAGQPKQAIASFSHALAAKPNLFTAVLFTGVDLAALNHPSQAIPWLDRALRLQPANPDALIALGKSYTAISRPNEAAVVLEKAVTSSPANSSAWFSLAMARLALIDRDGGRLAHDHANDPWSQALYAQDLLVQGRTSEAVDAFHQAAAGATPRQRALFAALLTSETSPQSDVPQEAATRARAAVRGTGITEPPSCPSSAVDSSPACQYLHGDAKSAATQAAARLLSHPEDPEALFWSVKANEPLSVAALSTFERLAPQSPVTFDLLGDLYRRRLQPDRALEVYNRALAVDPEDASALLGSAAAYLATGRLDQAIATARSALQTQPGSSRLNLLLGQALVSQHHLADARPFVERALSTAAASNLLSLLPSAHALLGQIEADAGDLRGAIADLTLGLPSDTDGSLSFQLSRLYRRQGQLALANQAEAHAKDLLASRRAHAVTAVAASSEGTP